MSFLLGILIFVVALLFSVMPTIFTKPPAGIALTPYSVSPFRVDQSVWPNPTKNWVTFMPNFLAVTK